VSAGLLCTQQRGVLGLGLRFRVFMKPLRQGAAGSLPTASVVPLQRYFAIDSRHAATAFGQLCGLHAD
jgi:hypothetical protein